MVKTRAVLASSKSGVYCFLVHPEDYQVFTIKLRRLAGEDKKEKETLLLSVSKWYPPRTNAQNDKYRGLLRYMCSDTEGQLYGSDPDNLHEGVLVVAALSYGYPTIKVAGVRVPERSHNAITKNMNILIEVAQVLAGEYGVDLSSYHLEDQSD